MGTLAMLARYGPVMLIWVALHAYVAWRLIQPAQLTAWRRTLAWVIAAIVAVLPLAALGASRAGARGAGATMLYWGGFTLLGFASLVVVFVLARDAVAVLLDIGRRIRGRRQDTTPRSDDDDLQASLIDRRQFLTHSVNMGILGSSGVLTGVGVHNALSTPAVREVDVPVEGLDPALEGFRIVQLSDLHVGPTVGREAVERIVERVNELGADLVALTGDFVDGHVDRIGDQLKSLGTLRSRHGTYFVSGNHEYYWDVRAWITAFRGLGLTVLENEHRVIDHDGATFVVSGVRDLDAHHHDPEFRTDVDAALRGAPPGFCLLLAHQPRSVFDAERVGGVDLQLSGHTHGGQYFPLNLVVWLVQPYLAGLHRARNLWIYVSRGVAYWGPPIRVGAPTEISLLRLTSR